MYELHVFSTYSWYLAKQIAKELRKMEDKGQRRKKSTKFWEQKAEDGCFYFSKP
jgi:hypothetical protein